MDYEQPQLTCARIQPFIRRERREARIELFQSLDNFWSRGSNTMS